MKSQNFADCVDIDQRLKAKAEGSTRLAYTELRGGLEHLKIETRLIDEV